MCSLLPRGGTSCLDGLASLGLLGEVVNARKAIEVSAPYVSPAPLLVTPRIAAALGMTNARSGGGARTARRGLAGIVR